MINTVIFDIGNVLMRFKWKPFAEKYFGERAQEVSSVIWASGWWNELDRGVLTPEEVVENAVELNPDYADEIRFSFENVGECASRLDYAVPWIEELKAKGRRVLYLSNYSHFYIGKRPDVLDFLTHMDGGVFSCDAHMVKPEPAIYNFIAQKYSLNPSECVFIDDKPVNCVLARKCGFNAIVFRDYKTVYDALNAMLD